MSNPVYAGMLQVKPFKEYPGGLFPAIHEPIIDKTTWRIVQQKMKKPEKIRTVIDDNIPLRGILKCHCGNPVSGAASRGKAGKYFYYYKCRFPKHNNISAIKAHDQLLGAFELMSLSERRIKEVKSGAEKAIETEMKENRKRLKDKKSLLEQEKEKLYSLEEKWIKNEIGRDTYERWYTTLNENILDLDAAVERLGNDDSKAFSILSKNFDLLTDMKYVYQESDTLEKREFVSTVFDNNLYYQEGIYRTPTMMRMFAHNALKMREKNYLIYEEKEGLHSEIPLSGKGGIRTLEPVTPTTVFPGLLIRPL